MYHFFEAITNTKGDALSGYYVKLKDSAEGVVALYSDDAGTAIINDSLIADTAKVDSDGNVSFYVEPGTYNLDIYSTDATTFVKRVSNIPMGLSTITLAAGGAVSTISALQDIASPVAGQLTLLSHATRGGTFVFDTSDLSTEVAADTAQGIYVAPSSDTTGASGAWVRKFGGPRRITPRMFGAAGGYDTPTAALAGTDDTTAIQAMLDFWASNPSYTPDFLGEYWTVSSEITIQQLNTGLEHAAQMLFGGTFVAKTGTSGTRLVTINAPGIHIIGEIGAIGCGSADGNCITYANRSWDYGIYLVGSYNIQIDRWYAANFKRWGFDATPENMANLGNQSSNTGSNIGVRVGPGNAFNCGSAAGQTNGSQLTYTINTITYNGTTGSTSQTTTVHFTEALDTSIKAGDDFVYTDTTGKRTCYSVKTVDLVANTLEFYFWLPSSAAALQTMDSAHGGFLHIHGSNSGEGDYGAVEGIRAGVGCKDSGLYGSHVGSVHVESSGICHVTGNPPSNAAYGGSTKGLHCESTYLMLVHRGITPCGRLVGTSSANGNGTFAGNSGFFSQFYHQRPRYSSNNLVYYGTAGIVLVDGNGAVVANENGPNQYDSDITTLSVSNRPSERFALVGFSLNRSPVVTLNWYDEYNEGWGGKNWMGFEFQGIIGGRNALTQVTVQLSSAMTTAGWTLNGGSSSLVYTQMRGPCRGIGIADVKNKNIKFSIAETEPQGLAGTASNGDAAATLNAGTSKKTQIWNAPLTAARAVTLQTTNVIDGDTFLITRTAASTGAFNLNVGTGPLKALATGQWCRVTYSSTLAAWVLSEFGSL